MNLYIFVVILEILIVYGYVVEIFNHNFVFRFDSWIDFVVEFVDFLDVVVAASEGVNELSF